VSDRTPRSPKPLQWWLEDIAHRVLDVISARLSGPQAFHLGEMLGGLAWRILPKRRCIVIRNLRIATGGTKTREEIISLARESFRRTGANLITVAQTAQVPPERLSEVVCLTNPEVLAEALAKKKGLVLLLTHMGNWELLSRIVHFFPEGTPSGAFYRPLNNPTLNNRVRARREADGVQMFSKGDNPLHVAAFLRTGAVVGILADQRVGPQGEPVRFFGRLTRASPLPALLARRVRCPVLALSLTCVKPGSWEAEFLTVEDPPNTTNSMLALESAMQRSLVDVFWFQQRWRTYLTVRKTPAAWLGEGSSAEGHRHRALIVIPGGESSWAPPATWLHPDIGYETIHLQETTTASLRQRLRELEWSAPMPVDFILTRNAPRALQNACRAESIHLVSLP
jgi:Kdo2-lipid IVA lauroyltransferase/acyltransferase